MNQTVNAEYANQISRVSLLTEILSQSCSSSKRHASADSITVQFYRDGNQLCEYSYVEGRGVKIEVSEDLLDVRSNQAKRLTEIANEPVNAPIREPIKKPVVEIQPITQQPQLPSWLGRT